MARTQTFARLDVLPSWIVNRIQDAVGSLASNFRVTQTSDIAVTVPAGAGEDAAVISIDGLWRFNEAPVARNHPGGAAGTYALWATAAAQNITNVPNPGTDLTNYAFDLAWTAVAGAPVSVPGTVDVWRKVAEAEWDGAKITEIRPWLNQRREGDPLIAVPQRVYEPAVTARALPSQTGPLLRVQTSGLSDLMTVEAAGQLRLPVTGSSGGLLLGGDVPAYRGAAAVLQVDAAVASKVAASGTTFRATQTGDTFPRAQIDLATSALQLGPGNSAPDASLARAAGPLLRASVALSAPAYTADALVGTATAALTLTGRNAGSANAATLTASSTGGLTLDTAAAQSLSFSVGGTQAANLSLARLNLASGVGLQLNGTPLAASHLSNGVTGAGAVVLAGGTPTFTGNPVVDPGSGTTNAVLWLVARNAGAAVNTSIAGATSGAMYLDVPSGGSAIWRANLVSMADLTSARLNLAAGVGLQFNGTALAASHLSNGVIGSGAVVLANAPVLTTMIGRGTHTFQGAGVVPSLTITEGQANNPGYVSWVNTANQRLGYLGFNNTTLDLMVEQATTFQVLRGTAVTRAAEASLFTLSWVNPQSYSANLAVSRGAIIAAPTYQGSGGARTITDAASLAIAGAPIAGANMTITNAHALWVQSGRAQFDGVVALNGDDVTTGPTTIFTVPYIAQFTGSVELGDFLHTGTQLGFYNGLTVPKPTVIGSRGGNAALGSLLTALASQGLVTNSSTA